MTPALATTMSQNASTGSPYVEGPVHPNTKPYATFETKPGIADYTGGGYEHWRSTERRPHTARQGKEDVYASHHRLLAVVACYDLDTPIEDALEHLRDRDVHHNAPEVDQDAGIPFDNRPAAIEVLDHRRHSERTQAQVRAWAEDAKQAAEQPPQPTPHTEGDSDECPGCGREDADVVATSPGFDGTRCVECAMEECDGERIDLRGGA